MDTAWVGTWRPHRPRGPIMAQFTSPGPKYSIPGTTGYLAHNPTKARAPAYTFQGAKPPLADTCSPGPCYYVQPSVTRNGKHMAPAHHICGLPKIKTEVTPGPSDYSVDKANKHHYKCAPEQSMAFRHKAIKTNQTPGPATYTLPRLVGPNTAYTRASPCYSMTGKSKSSGFAEDLSKVSYAPRLSPTHRASSAPLLRAEGLQHPLQPLLMPLGGGQSSPAPTGISHLLGETGPSAGEQDLPFFPPLRPSHTAPLASWPTQRSPPGHPARNNACLLGPATRLPLFQTPGPAAFPKVELDIYKQRAPTYVMGTKARPGGDQTVKPGPADYCLGKVTLIKRQAPAPTFGLRHSSYTIPLIPTI
ncbi:ciliary microtubule associated protein 1A-like [Pluvialis apricaria]